MVVAYFGAAMWACISSRNWFGITAGDSSEALLLASKVAVITGRLSTGKTTLLDAILRILLAKGVRVLLAAPHWPRRQSGWSPARLCPFRRAPRSQKEDINLPLRKAAKVAF